jgi:hypothetical protein
VNYDATEHSKHALLHHGHYLQNTSSNYQHARPALFPAGASAIGSGDHASSWTSLAAYNRQNQLRDQNPTLQQYATDDDISRMSAMLELVQQQQQQQQQARSTSRNGKQPINAEAAGTHDLSRMGDDELVQRARAELASLQYQQSNTSRDGIRYQDPTSLNQAFRNHHNIAMNPETSTNDASRLLLANSFAEQQRRHNGQAGIPRAMAFQQQERRSEASGCAMFPHQEYEQNVGLYEAYLHQQRQQTMRAPSRAAADNNYDISPFDRALPMASSLSTGSQLESQQGILRRMHTAANNSVGRYYPNNHDSMQDQEGRGRRR